MTEVAVPSPIVRWLFVLTVLAIAVALSACSDSPPPTPEPTAAATATLSPEPTATAAPEPARPTSVTVSPAAVDLTALGATAQLRMEVRDLDLTVMTGVTVTWTTSASSVATVDAAGVVTGAGNGTATITASAGQASGSAVVTVTQEVASVEVSPSVTELTAWGETIQLAAEALDANGHAVAGAEFSWESAYALVATVDALGVVTASGNGTATIMASAGSASGSAVVTVTQEVASVEVSPSMTELTAWGEIVQMAAEAFDANRHPVVGVEFYWESADALVAEVDALGLVSGIAEGEATITASAGAASGSAMVTVPPTFTLSGTVRDSRKNGPVLAGAVVRLENGKVESMVIGPDGGYRFPNVWGTVTVRVIAEPTHETETVEIAMEEDRTLDFKLEHTGTPPFHATTLISPQVIEPSDPTTLESITYAGRGELPHWDKQSEMTITIDTYLFDVRYAGHVVEFRVYPELGSREAAQGTVETYIHALGQIPAVLMPGIKHVDIHPGEGRWNASQTLGIIVIYPDREPGDFGEVFVHEATHTTLDQTHEGSPGWRAAQEADGVFISEYARDNPDTEDVAESFLAWFAVRYQSERLTTAEIISILRTIPNRLTYFDEQGFDMSPYTPSEIQYPSEEIVTIQGKVIGPNNQPVEGTFLRAWPDGADTFVDNVGTATTGEDGSFAIVVPDGSFILDVFAPGVSTESNEGCTFVGWHGPGGFTAVREHATRFKVDDGSVLDIVIRLPDHPDALPRIEWCA
ncbi:MAG: Ig-like domain-containing protein [Chloroflexi bacterium]|nr:Ig-like domain-containing protein [Chloroflexota bacterium]